MARPKVRNGYLAFFVCGIAGVLPGNRPTGVNHHMAWETLTHAGMGAIGLPPAKK